MNARKLMALSTLLVSGATLFQNGCLNAFFQGFFNTGWPEVGDDGDQNNRVLNLAVDILNEELFG